MSDFWSDLTAPSAPPEPAATPSPPARRTATREPRDLGSIPLADAWLIFRAADDGRADDVRVARGSHLNRLRPDEPRDWTHDVQLVAFAPADQPVAEIKARDAWQGFLRAWPIDPAHLAAAMREAARVEGLEWLHGMAAIYQEAAA